MDKLKLTGAVLATAVGLLFAAQPLLAGDSAGSQVKCVGGNSCKGLSSCKSAESSCKGQNSCKGKGWVLTSSADECAQKGGTVEKK